MNAGDLHREAIGLAVGPWDLNLLPLTVRWVYTPEALSRQAHPVRPSGWRIGKGSAGLRTLVWRNAHATVWRHRAA